MFGFYFGIVNVMQLLGYGFSSILTTYAFFGQPHGFVIALSAMFVTSLVFYLVRGDLDSKTTAFTNAEFIALSHVPIPIRAWSFQPILGTPSAIPIGTGLRNSAPIQQLAFVSRRVKPRY